MLQDLDRLGPELILMVAAGFILLAGIVLPGDSFRGRTRTGWAALSGIAASIIWAVVLALRDRQGPFFGGAMSLDNLSVFFIFLFLGVAALVVIASMEYAPRFGRNEGEFYCFLLLATSGAMLLAGSRDLIAIFVALELTSISQYVMAGLLRTDRAGEAGLKYLLLGAVATAVILYGMALLYGLSGTTKLVAPGGEPSILGTIASADPGIRSGLLVAIVLLAAGFGFKMATVPFQMWAPDVYQGAATPVAAFLSVASKSAGFAVVLRIFYEGMGDAWVNEDWSILFGVLAAVSMTVGNAAALVQTNVKRLLGYSSIAQAGNMMVGLAAIAASDETSLGAAGVAFFLATYVFTNLGAFFAVQAISDRIGSDEIADYAGMARRAPWQAAVLAFCLVSLTGLPPAAGFVAKVYIFNAAAHSDLMWLVIIGVLNSVLSAFYYLRLAGVMYTAEPATEEPVPIAVTTGAAMTIAAAGVLVVGIIPFPLIEAAQRAANILV